MRKIVQVAKTVINFIKTAGNFIATILFTATIVFLAVIYLSIPIMGWVASFYAGVLVAGLHFFKWPIKILALIFWGPVIAIVGYYTLYRGGAEFLALIQAGICWIIFTGTFVLVRYCARYRISAPYYR